jgi:glycosyltransferase involved in cell wall biosynthesis
MLLMTPKIKIAHIITLLELGGAQKGTLHILRTLDRQRFQPLLICGRGGILDPETKRENFPTFVVPSLVRSISPLKDVLALLRLWVILRREKPHIVHTNSSKAGILGRWAARLAGVPVIVHTFHGFGFNREQKPWVRWIFILLEKKIAPLSAALTVVSQANRTEALALGIGQPEQYHLIRCGVPLVAYKTVERGTERLPGIPVEASHRLVTTVGPFKPQKNLGDFIRAAALVSHERPDVRFVVLGDGALRSWLEEEIHRHNLEKVVFLPGWRRDVSAVLSRTTVFCMTSLWEGLPCALLEAMAAGLPSVVNAVDGTRDVIRDGENGFLVPPKHPDLTAKKLLALLEDSLLADRLGRQARADATEEFDENVMVHRQEALYTRLMDNGI